MQKHFAAWLVAVSLLVVLAACQPVQPVETADTEAPALATFTHPDGLFTVQYPEGWYASNTNFEGPMPPYVTLGSNQAIIDASDAWEPLPEDQIGIALMLLPRAFFAEAGLTDDMTVEEAFPLVFAIMMEGTDSPEEESISEPSEPETLTLADGTPAVRTEMAAPTEEYQLTLADVGDGLLLFAPRIQAVGADNPDLAAQIDAALASFEATASGEEVMAYVMAAMEAGEGETE